MNIEKLKKMYPLQIGINNPILRQKSKEIQVISDDIKNFAEVLLALMYEYDWVGLAAPQIGQNIRIIAVTKWDVKGDKFNFIKDQIMINPEILWHSKETEIDEEGCLSVPWVKGDVERFQSIRVKYLDINWKPMEETLTGFNARIVQHEIDHLDGILFVDKLIWKSYKALLST